MRRRIRLTESHIDNIVSETIKSVLNERWEQREGKRMEKRETPPEITLTVYKQVRLPNDKKTGMVYPLYVDKNNGWEIGQWYNAGVGDYKIEIDDVTNEPTGKVKVNSKMSKGLAFRPGLHFGSVPYAPHIYTRKPNFDDEKKPENLDSKGKLRKDYDFSKTRLQTKNIVWAECEISFDKDYNKKAYENGLYTNKKGQQVNNPAKSCLSELPVDGAYKYRTNASAPDWCTWYIAGAFKINRLLSDEEVKEICSKHNVVSLERDGILDLSEYPLLQQGSNP